MPSPSQVDSQPQRQTQVCSSSSINTLAIQELTQDEYDKKPWKYIGYKGYAKFIASDDDFYLLRRFGTLNARIALSLQNQVVMLEEQLDEMDIKYSKRDAEDLHNGSFRDDKEDRTQLVNLIHDKLTQYNTFLLQQTELKKYPSSFEHDIESIKTWHQNHDNFAIAEEEQRYLYKDRDLVSVMPKTKTPLRHFLDRFQGFRHLSFWHKEEAATLPMYDKEVIFTSEKKIERFITILTVGIGTAMLIAPMWILNALNNPSYKLAVITTFIIVFLGMLSYATVAKPFETLAATAAYSAVLMVFLQLGTANS